MKSKNLVICDREKGYADAFARYIMQKEELALQVQTCSDLSHVLSIQEQEGIDYLFISSGYPPGDRGQAEAGTVFVLTEDEEDTLLEGETQVYKYQSGDELLAELIRKCREYIPKEVKEKAGKNYWHLLTSTSGWKNLLCIKTWEKAFRRGECAVSEP